VAGTSLTIHPDRLPPVDPGFRLVAFTVDETVWLRESAPLAGFYPSVDIDVPGMPRRVDAGFLARPVAEHRLDEHEALETAAVDLVTGQPTRVFEL
jgi:glucuronate isomerase